MLNFLFYPDCIYIRNTHGLFYRSQRYMAMCKELNTNVKFKCRIRIKYDDMFVQGSNPSSVRRGFCAQ